MLQMINLTNSLYGACERIEIKIKNGDILVHQRVFHCAVPTFRSPLCFILLHSYGNSNQKLFLFLFDAGVCLLQTILLPAQSQPKLKSVPIIRQNPFVKTGASFDNKYAARCRNTP